MPRSPESRARCGPNGANAASAESVDSEQTTLSAPALRKPHRHRLHLRQTLIWTAPVFLVVPRYTSKERVIRMDQLQLQRAAAYVTTFF